MDGKLRQKALQTGPHGLLCCVTGRIHPHHMHVHMNARNKAAVLYFHRMKHYTSDTMVYYFLDVDSEI